MKSYKYQMCAFVCLVLSLAVGGVWYLYQEDNVPPPASLGELYSSPVSAVEDESSGSMPADLELAEIDEDAPFEWPEGAVRGDLVMRFGSRSELEAFMRDARRAGLGDLEAIPALNMVRIRVGSDEQLRRALRLGENGEISFNPVVENPNGPAFDAFAGAYRPFGDQALAWMGVPDNNEAWGKGVRIAILDTGVVDHPSLANASITHLSMLDGRAEKGGHGTAVASLIVGQGEVRGIAPAAELLSIQVLDGNGVGNGFDLADGITAAVEAGANPVILSLGTPTHNTVVWEAIKYGQDRGVVFVASGGNDGGGNLLYPAAYPGVISVGSVDANAQYVPFSNQGDNLTFTAPGFGLIMADAAGGTMYGNGTSFSGPLVGGAIASLFPEMPPRQAVEIVTQNADDAGSPGWNQIYGNGIPNMERVAERNTPGIYNLAVSGYHVDFSSGIPEMVVSVQNRGTESVGGISLEVRVDDASHTIQIGALSKGESAAGKIPLHEYVNSNDLIQVSSRVSAPGIHDIRPDDDVRSSIILLNPSDD